MTPRYSTQQGFALMFALILMLVMVLVVSTTLGNSIVQEKLATGLNLQSRAFAGAEAALEGVLFEANDDDGLVSTERDALSEARGQPALTNPADLTCFGGGSWTERSFGQATLQTGSVNQASGGLATWDNSASAAVQLESRAKVAFVTELPCAGSSVVIDGIMLSCHQFKVRGCGQVVDAPTATANTLTVEVMAPATTQ